MEFFKAAATVSLVRARDAPLRSSRTFADHPHLSRTLHLTAKFES